MKPVAGSAVATRAAEEREGGGRLTDDGSGRTISGDRGNMGRPVDLRLGVSRATVSMQTMCLRHLAEEGGRSGE